MTEDSNSTPNQTDTATFDGTQVGLLADREAVLANPSGYRVLTGDRPTGNLHIGHYLGTLQGRVQLQNAGLETWLVIADYQVITDRVDPGDLRRNVFGILADYLAVGIDPAQTTIFTHSSVPALNQLLLPFLSLVSLPELQRNPTVKDELANSKLDVISGLLLTYPVHQAADILFCHGNLVPVGRDQLPHLEQTRLVARRFNDRYAGGRQVLREPQALLSAAPSVMGLDGRKMSKSRGNTIPLAATADETAKLLKRAVTDADRNITFDPDNRPEVSNLVLVGALMSGQDPVEFAAAIGDAGGKALKDAVTEAVNEHLRPIRARRLELADDEAYLASVLAEGNARANEVANQTLTDVQDAIGMNYTI